MTTPRRKTAPTPTEAALAPLPPLPGLFADLLTDTERRELHATGMDEQGILTFISCVWLGLLFEEWTKLEFEAAGQRAAKDAHKGGGSRKRARKPGAKRKGGK